MTALPKVDSLLDLTWIIPKQLAMGGVKASSFLWKLKEQYNISCLVDLRAEITHDSQELQKAKIEVLHLPTPDLCSVSQTMLNHGVAWVRNKIELNKPVFIHCYHGIGRSALLMCCVLVDQGYSPDEALRHVKACRHVVSPSPDQLHAFVEWSENWYLKKQVIKPKFDWETLARIAYQPAPISRKKN